MGPFQKSILIFFGAGLGANLRYWLGGWVQSRTGSIFPWGTVFVNASGGLVMGLFMALILRQGWPLGWRLFFAIGVLGGYTTFSTFSYETIALFQERAYGLALGNIAISNLASIAACWLGIVITRATYGS